MQQAKKLCRDIMRAVKQLKDKRDMSLNECKLTIAIEDPRARERRESMGIEVRQLANKGFQANACNLHDAAPAIASSTCKACLSTALASQSNRWHCCWPWSKCWQWPEATQAPMLSDRAYPTLENENHNDASELPRQLQSRAHCCIMPHRRMLAVSHGMRWQQP